MYCENDVSAPLEEDLPDMELGILGGEVLQDGGGLIQWKRSNLGYNLKTFN